MGLNSEVVLKRGFPVVVFTESDSIIRQQLFIYIYMTFICWPFMCLKNLLNVVTWGEVNAKRFY